MDEELRALAQSWQAWNGEASNWLQKAQLAHRREAALHAAYWAALLFGALAMALQAYLHGIVSWPRVLFGGATLLFGAGAMLRASAQIAKTRRALRASPEAVIADLRQVLERELEGWTARWVKWTLGVLVCASTALVVEHLLEAVRQHQSLLGPTAILISHATALAIVARVGLVRVRSVRRELAELARVQRELAE